MSTFEPTSDAPEKNDTDDMDSQTSPIEEIEEEESEQGLESAKGVFDPRQIDISVEQKSIDFLLGKLEYDLERLEEDEFDPNAGIIDLNTEFQRSRDLWSKEQMSRLIESLLISFPIPPFYFDTSDRYRWQVVDGLQRLSALYKLIIEKDPKKRLKLSGLQFLPHLNGKNFEGLSETQQRTIKSAQAVLYLIRSGTPKQVKYRVFERVNTGALKLTYQEIRHALNIGIPANYVKELANSSTFRKFIRLSNHRMQDRELVLRYLAFRMSGYKNYSAPMFAFLDQAMESLYKILPNDRFRFKTEFEKSLELCHDLFGDHLFSKSILDPVHSKRLLNKALFEAWTVLISDLTDQQRDKIRNNREELRSLFCLELSNKDFDRSISQSTAGVENVRLRFERISSIIAQLIN